MTWADSAAKTMSTPLAMKEEDITKMLAAYVHLGTKNCDFQMTRYVWKRRNDGIFLINLAKTWDKLMLAARIIVTVENPQDVCVISARPYGQRAVLKYAQYTGAQALAGRFTPGTFTNQIQKKFMEPRLLVLTDPRTDQQSITESSYVNIPTIAFCDGLAASSRRCGHPGEQQGSPFHRPPVLAPRPRGSPSPRHDCSQPAVGGHGRSLLLP